MWGIDPTSGTLELSVFWKIFAIDFNSTADLNELWTIVCFFGLVGSIYYSLLCVFQLLYIKKLLNHLIMGVASGIIGSLQFWIIYGDGLWYFSLLHGTIWGSFVGYGIWVNVRDIEQNI